jgi:hypothetical protein
VIAVILGVRTRSLARAHGLVVPGRALAAIGVGGFAVVATIVFWIWIGSDMKRVNERRTDLRRRLENRTAQVKLDQETACAMVELRLLEQGFEGTSEFGIDGVHCDGVVTEEGDRATLDDVGFIKSSKPWKGIACFRRGARWSIDKLTTAARCDEPPSPPAAPSQGGAAPASTGAGRRKTDGK